MQRSFIDAAAESIVYQLYATPINVKDGRNTFRHDVLSYAEHITNQVAYVTLFKVIHSTYTSNHDGDENLNKCIYSYLQQYLPKSKMSDIQKNKTGGEILAKILSKSIIKYCSELFAVSNDLYSEINLNDCPDIKIEILELMKTCIQSVSSEYCLSLIAGNGRKVSYSKYKSLNDKLLEKTNELNKMCKKYQVMEKKYSKAKSEISNLSRRISELEYDIESEITMKSTRTESSGLSLSDAIKPSVYIPE